MAGYVKLFGSILQSTVWGLSSDARVVWITLLALADSDGNVAASVPGLARSAVVPLEKTEAAITGFLAPDLYSQSAEFEGRRIVKRPEGGWHILNHDKYKRLLSAEHQRDRNAEKQRRHYAKAKANRDLTEANQKSQNNPIQIRSRSESDPDQIQEEKRERERESAAFAAPLPPVVKIKVPKAVRGTRLPDGWYPSPDLIKDIHARLAVDPIQCLGAFQDWAWSASGAVAVKLDWDAAFRGWVRRELKAGKLRLLNGHNADSPVVAHPSIQRRFANLGKP